MSEAFCTWPSCSHTARGQCLAGVVPDRVTLSGVEYVRSDLVAQAHAEGLRDGMERAAALSLEAQTCLLPSGFFFGEKIAKTIRAEADKLAQTAPKDTP